MGAAIALARQGHKVEVFEQADGLEQVGAGIQLSPNAMQVLAAYGLEPAIAKVGFEPSAGVLRDYKSGKTLVETPFGLTAYKRYGQRYYHIHRADLISLLYDKALACGVTFSFNTAFEDLHQHDCDLLVGADGIKSQVQNCLFGQRKPRWTGQVAWRATVLTECLPDGLVEPKATVWRGSGKHLVTYYIQSGELVNLVAVEERDTWTDESWQQAGDVQSLQDAFSGWHAQVTSLLDKVESTHLWGLFDRARLTNWSKGRVTLLGDACHPMLPFMAQGGAMALEDGWVLANQLSKHETAEVALASYEAVRKPRTSMLQKRSAANASLFHMHGGASMPINALKLKVASMLPSLAVKDLDSIYAFDVTSVG